MSENEIALMQSLGTCLESEYQRCRKAEAATRRLVDVMTDVIMVVRALLSCEHVLHNQHRMGALGASSITDARRELNEALSQLKQTK